MPEQRLSEMRVADVIVAALERAGIRRVFTLPGGGSMHLVDALAKAEHLRPFPCHHEQACGIAAEAYGRIAGPFGVVMVTTGPGATNVLTPLVGAWIESSPLIVLAGQVKRNDALGAGDGVRQKGVQEVPMVEAVSHWTKWSVTLDDPQQALAIIERAIHVATTGRPGPVWIDVPLDVQAAPVDASELVGYDPSVDSDLVLPPDTSEADVASILGRIAASERPLILAGHGVRVAGAADTFRALVDRLGVPVVLTWNASDLLPYDHPLFVGRPGSVAVRAPNFALQNCDLLVAIGARIDPVVSAYDRDQFARGAQRLIVDVDAAELDKFDRSDDIRIHADARALCRQLVDTISGDARPYESSGPRLDSWRLQCADWKRRFALCDGEIPSPDGTIGHYRFIDALSDAVPEGTLIATGSSGLAVEVFYMGFRNKRGQRIFLTSGLGAMGYGLAAAIGVCVATGRPVLCLESDGSLMLNVQELATISHHRLPITIILMNNAGYASIRNTQRNYFAGRFVGTDGPSGLGFPDWSKLADAFGIGYAVLDHPAGLTEALAASIAAPSPSLINVRLESDVTLWPKVAAVPMPDGSMRSMPLEDMSPQLSLEALTREMPCGLAPASIAVRRAG